MKQAFLLSALLLLLCGLGYPLLVTGVSRLAFPSQAEGSLVKKGQTPVASALVGQEFTDPRLLHGRPSAVRYNTYVLSDKAESRYTGPASGSENLAPSNPRLVERVSREMRDFTARHPNTAPGAIPGELLTSSGSGLDPHISPAAAKLQITAMATHSGLSETTLENIITKHTAPKLWGLFGEPTVHVAQVNMEIRSTLEKK